MKTGGKASVVRPGIEVFGNQGQINGYFIDKWARLAERAIRERGAFYAALPGGASPTGVFGALGRSPVITGWERTHIFLTDERMVPYSDKDSNFRQIAELLLEQVAIPWKNVHPVETGIPAAAAAEHYEETLKKVFGAGKIPVFDFIMLGIGENGHTASLFPGSRVLLERDRLTAASTEPRSGLPRVTLTLPVLNAAREVVFLVTGAGKAKIVKKVLADGLDVPASSVRPGGRDPVYVLDSAAARYLDTTEE